jgi:glycosyltransferase involved in cell wall biosynthesis
LAASLKAIEPRNASLLTDLQTPIHIVLVVRQFDAGGMERYLAALINGLPADAFRVSLVCLDRAGTATHWLTRCAAEVVELNLPGGNVWTASKVLHSALCRLKPNVVHSHNWATLVETYLAVKRYGTAVHLHSERGSVLGSDSCSPIKRKIRASVMRWICQRISLATNSHRVADTISSITGVARTKIQVIPNGIEPAFTVEQLPSARKIIRDQLGLTDQAYLAGTVGRLAAVKNLELAVRALAQAPQPLRNAMHLLFVGDGPCRQGLESLVDKLALREQVHFVGHQWDTWKYLAAMDVFFNCSHSEGMSQSMLEAMAVGLPIVATDVGDARELLLSAKPCGIVLPCEDIKSFVDALITMSSMGYRQKLASASL